MSFTTITLKATYQDDQGNPSTGRVTVQATGEMQDTSTSEIRKPTLIPVNLDATGSVSIPVTATDDTTTTPTTVQYEVMEEITGVPTRTYLISVPHASAGGILNLSTVAP